jgi:uncharacterized repeat protein (TIGR02543 family)
VISGRVLNSSGKPVKGATVKLVPPSGGTKTAKTNAKGIYSFRVAKSGKHTLSAISGSLKSAKRTVSVQLGQAATLTLDAQGNLTSSSSGRLGNSWGNDLVVKLPPTMTIAFNANGGKCSLKRRTVKTGSRIGKLPTAKRSGWKFLGWYTKKSGGGKVSAKTVIKANGTFYAHWAKNHCKVTFKANGGKGKMAAQKLPYNKTVKLSKNKFTRKGYAFIGWALSKNGEVAYGNAAKMKNMRASGKPLTLYAKWARKYCRVTFKANGGKGKMGVQKLPYLKVVRLAKNKYTRKGYRFAGWALSPTGKVEFKNAEKVRNERASGIPLVLYARWKKVGTDAASAPKDSVSAPRDASSAGTPSGVAQKLFTVDDCGVFAVGGFELEVISDSPTVEELADREEAEALATPLAVTFQVPEGGVAWQFWSAESGILAEDAVTSSTIDLELPDLGLWHWLRFFDEEGGTLSSTWLFPAAAE